jgi:putative addiction module component (TIGR02574 family)
MNAKSLLAEALQLPAGARAARVGELIDSLDQEPTDPDAEAAWAEEIRRRIADVDDGRVRPVPWSVARQRILAAAGGDADPR